MKKYTYDKVLKKTLNYFNNDSLSTDVWIKKYCLKDSHGNLYEASPEDMHHRLAKEFARIELKYPNPVSEKKIFELFDKFKYIIPQGSPMSGIGNSLQTTSISNCFVVGNEADSYGGLLHTDQEQVQLMKRRGGVGHDLSHIRPSGTPVYNSALTSTGIVPFMERYSNSTREVAQDGRRGALMLTMEIRHPDSLDFINAKKDLVKVTGANISIKLDDVFMNAVRKKDDYFQTFPVDLNISDYLNSADLDNLKETAKYDELVSIGEKTYVKRIDAKKLWDTIIENAWTSAEPGLLFWDTIINESPADSYENFKTISVNPCGEITLCAYDSCRLLAVNLFSYVEKAVTKKAFFNFDLFKQHIRIAQRLSDDIIDLELEKIDTILAKIVSDPESEEHKRIEKELWLKIKDKAETGRRTGLGITGEGDMLAALGLQYGVSESIKVSELVHKTKAIAAYTESVEMAKERGSFKDFDPIKDVQSLFIKRLIAADNDLKLNMAKYGRRNISLLTIAPTGSTSLMTQTTSGIEPVFMPYYKRRRKINPQEKDTTVVYIDSVGDSWTEYNIFHHNFLKWAGIKGYDIDELKLLNADDIDAIIVKSPYHKSTSNDIDWIKKVNLQGAVQKWIDHSISVTVNVPNDISVEKVGEIYETAHSVGCKGITIYRDGSRDGVLVKSDTVKKITSLVAKRPEILPCDIHHITANKNQIYVIVGLLDNKPYEIFAFSKKHISIPQLKKEGKLIKVSTGVYNLQYNGTTIDDIAQHFESPEEDAFTRMLSLLLKKGVGIAIIVDQLNKAYSTSMSSIYKAIARSLQKNYMSDADIKNINGNVCAECGSSNLAVQEGCIICLECGSGKCG